MHLGAGSLKVREQRLLRSLLAKDCSAAILGAGLTTRTKRAIEAAALRPNESQLARSRTIVIIAIVRRQAKDYSYYYNDYNKRRNSRRR